jgi:hypothetical protein
LSREHRGDDGEVVVTAGLRQRGGTEVDGQQACLRGHTRSTR